MKRVSITAQLNKKLLKTRALSIRQKFAKCYGISFQSFLKSLLSCWNFEVQTMGPKILDILKGKSNETVIKTPQQICEICVRPLRSHSFG